MIEIKLTQDQNTLIDKEDYLRVSQFKWYAHYNSNKQYYALTGSKYKRQSLHRLIMSCPKGLCVDHINHDTLDNRKINLRICTKAENCRNRRSNIGISKYKGVTFHKGKWRSRICLQRKDMHLGYFDTEQEAALTYNMCAKMLHGEFAKLNEVKDVNYYRVGG